MILWVCTVVGGAVVPPERMEQWSRDLGSREFPVREAATREIWSLGEAAVPWLRKAADDRAMPERMLRARDLLRKIRYEIAPDTDPKVIGWVEEYAAASLVEKARLLGLLKGKRAWFPMLRLVSDETDAEARRKLEPQLEGVPQRAARESLAVGRTDRARLAMALAPQSPKALMAWAVFHRQQGTWQQEWDRLGAAEKAGPRGLALLRSADRISEARDLALGMKDKLLGAWFSAMEGDPVDWLASVNPQTEGLEAEYVELAQRRWEGMRPLPDDLQPLVRRASGSEGSSRQSATQLLFMLAEPGMAAPALSVHSPLSAFQYYEQMEMIPEALSAVGIDPRSPDYRSWFAMRLENHRKLDVDNLRGVDRTVDELVAMAGFLERRGMDELLDDVLAEPLRKFAREERISFVDFLSPLFGSSGGTSGAPRLAARVASEWAGVDEDRWSDVLASAFGDEEEVTSWWGFLGKLEPGNSLSERLWVQMALFRIGPDPQGRRSRTMAKALARAKSDPEWAAALGGLALRSDDSALLAAVEDRLPAGFLDELPWEARIHFLSAQDRWSEVSDVIARHIARQKEGGAVHATDVHAHAYLAAALRLCDREAEAREHDGIVEALYLGDSTMALQIGHGYAYGRDLKRARIWWKRACVEGSMQDSRFTEAIKTLADAFLETGDWLRAASLSECLVRLYANSDYRWDTPLSFTTLRLQADTARAISRIGTQREAAIADLERCHRAYVTDGSLADVFFPSLRRVGLIEEHDRWFDITWKRLRAVIAEYPESENTRNTAAWIAARAARALDDGLADIRVALAKRPEQAAYLDTMAEIQFARGQRRQAVEWSSKAMAAMPADPVIRRQHVRFLQDPLPR